MTEMQIQFPILKGFPCGSAVKNLPVTQESKESQISIPGSGRSPGGGHGNPRQYSDLKNPMNRGAWQATYSPLDHTESDTTEHAHTPHTQSLQYTTSLGEV